jgi:hypothetical protein
LKKVTKVAIISALGLGVFASGFFGKDIVSHAGTSWSTTAENTAYSELLSTANSTKNDLVSNIDTDVNTTVNNAIQGTVDEQQAELKKLMEQYYQMKLDGLTNTPEYLALEQKIKDIQQSVLDSFKKQIDAEFATQTQGQ